MKTPHFDDQPLSLTPGGINTTLMLAKRCELPARDESVVANTLVLNCRTGEGAIALTGLFQSNIIGIDENADDVLAAKLACGEAKLQQRVSFKVMSPLQLDFPNESIDTIIAEGCITSYSIPRVLKECARVLKPHGMLAIADPIWRKQPVPTYVRELWESREHPVQTVDGWTKLLSEKGFTIRWQEDASHLLRDFYVQFTPNVKRRLGDDDSSRQMKSLVVHYKHEISVYTQQSGHKWMGYWLCVAEKND